MIYFKLNESPFYEKRPKIKSGAEITIKTSFNMGTGKVIKTAPAWIHTKRNFNPLFLN
jgi:hypothetical protein